MTIDTSKAITVNGIECYDEGLEEDYRVRAGANAVWKIVCAWSDRQALVRGLIGTSTGSGVNLEINPAARYPEDPIMAVSQVKVEGIGILGVNPVTHMATYELARLYVIFKNIDVGIGGAGGTIQLDIGEDLLLFNNDNGTPVFEFRTDDGSFSGDAPPSVIPAIPVGLVNFCIPQAALPDLRGNMKVKILDYVDCVNSDEFLGADPGTVMYKGCTALGRFVSGGQGIGGASVLEVSDLGHRMQWRRIPWNKWMNPGNGKFQTLVLKTASFSFSSGDPFFTPKEFSPVFDPAVINNLQPGGGITGG